MIRKKLFILSMILLANAPLRAAYDPFESLKNSATKMMISFGTHLKNFSGWVLILSFVVAVLFHLNARVTDDMNEYVISEKLSWGAGLFVFLSLVVYLIMWCLLR